MAGTAVASLVDGRLSVGPDTNEAFIQRLYEGLLGRGNEATGMTYWDHWMETGASKLDVANGFLNAPEFLAQHGPASSMSDTQFVSLLVGGLYGRTPGAAELQSLIAQIAVSGGSQAGRASVTASAADSAEAKRYLATDTAQVWARNDAGTLTHELFETGLGREVELSPGLAFWKATAASATPLDIADGVMKTPEFQALHAGQNDVAYVTSLYRGGLGRAPEQQGLQYYLDRVQAGASRADVLLAIATSPEATGHLTRNL